MGLYLLDKNSYIIKYQKSMNVEMSVCAFCAFCGCRDNLEGDII